MLEAGSLYTAQFYTPFPFLNNSKLDKQLLWYKPQNLPHYTHELLISYFMQPVIFYYYYTIVHRLELFELNENPILHSSHPIILFWEGIDKILHWF